MILHERLPSYFLIMVKRNVIIIKGYMIHVFYIFSLVLCSDQIFWIAHFTKKNVCMFLLSHLISLIFLLVCLFAYSEGQKCSHLMWSCSGKKIAFLYILLPQLSNFGFYIHYPNHTFESCGKSIRMQKKLLPGTKWGVLENLLQ